MQSLQLHLHDPRSKQRSMMPLMLLLRIKSRPEALNILTNFMLSWVVRNLYGIQLEAAVALSYVIDPGDVRAHFIDHLHKLWKVNNKASALDILYKVCVFVFNCWTFGNI